MNDESLKRRELAGEGRELRAAKKEKVQAFWNQVRQKPKIEGWERIRPTLLRKHYGLTLEDDKEYRICGFDLDHTLITTKSKQIAPKGRSDWEFLYPQVCKKLDELALGEKNLIVIFTNQAGLEEDSNAQEEFKVKLDTVIARTNAAENGRIIVLAALGKDIFRKPSIGMWEHLNQEILKGQRIDKTSSFFVGDAAGRIAGWKRGAKSDFAATDRKWALNVGIDFYTPEEYFLEEAKVTNYDLNFPCHPETLLENKSLPDDGFDWGPQLAAGGTEMVLVVGPPGSGKTSLYEKYFKPTQKYVHINLDTLKTKQRCFSAIERAFKQLESVYIDNTNPTIEARASFIKIAQKYSIPVRCLQMQIDQYVCRHLDAFRSITRNIKPLPKVAFASYWSKLQNPTLNEGLASIHPVPFIPSFESKDQKELFCHYLI